MRCAHRYFYTYFYFYLKTFKPLKMLLFILFGSCLLSLYLYMIRNFNYWKERGVKYIKPIPIIGNLLPIILSKKNIADMLNGIYREYKDEPYIGIFLADCPCLVVRDYEFVKKILVNDFNHFVNRSISTNKDVDPISGNSLFLLRNLDWKNTRAKLSQLFSNKKQKIIFNDMENVMERLDKVLQQSEQIEAMDLSLKISVDLISDSVFRLKGGAITNEKENTMKELADLFTIHDRFLGIWANLVFLIPELISFLRIPIVPKTFSLKINEAMSKIFVNAKTSSFKGDYMDFLLELKTKGPWEGNDGKMIYLNDEILTAHMFTFMTAGFETTSSGLGYCLYELARNPNLQEELRSEIKDVVNENDGKFTFESLKKFPSLLKFINECLRKHPPFPFINRECSKDYTIPGTNIVIQKGQKVLIPMMALQNDEKYYKNPENIILNRFDSSSPEANSPYFPFGIGPRTCLGIKFATQGIIITLVTILNKYCLSFENNLCPKLSMSTKTFNNRPKEDINIKIIPLQLK